MELTSAPLDALAVVQNAPLMPCFERGTHGFAHTVDSALFSLAAMGIMPERITLLRAGRSAHADGMVIHQQPSPGTPLTNDVRIELAIAGLGFTHALPVGMWDSGGERTPGTREILSPLDDPLEKLRHWFREGAPMFRLSPDDQMACARWLSLFGLRAEEWPRDLWFPLASLVADLPGLSCRPDGCAIVLGSVLGLPVSGTAYRPTHQPLPESALSLLGSRSSQLGTNLVIGDAIEVLSTVVIEIGPVPLDVYERFAESEEGAALLARLLYLLMPMLHDYEVHWSVQDRTQPPQLGVIGANSRLGVNTHMGKGSGVRVC
ncbi:type VI secretion system baseplate subunit TssG [Silvibacterium dinghuense]|uniref:Type VI secretion system baseplate subunit TssG n=1 Tax=Silvibacterium dinghuense TaxID=1560006 RepID=A0A4Q1SJ40_9BACT|nr:type VI secretion system baseplate subunit TssG [Silvibacterium dinghuense]RXS97437.1 hypothetical protein ESZ00_05945 [Silvibacterium dinghuense]GGG99011.1 hypothetical protein GCM10011586_13120 [Silvibacterium dinghuense]